MTPMALHAMLFVAKFGELWQFGFIYNQAISSIIFPYLLMLHLHYHLCKVGGTEVRKLSSYSSDIIHLRTRSTKARSCH